jgi:GMP synthase PP-ATPase subunit
LTPVGRAHALPLGKAAALDVPVGLCEMASTRFVNAVRGIHRVIYDASGKPPATIQWESLSRSTGIYGN